MLSNQYKQFDFDSDSDIVINPSQYESFKAKKSLCQSILSEVLDSALQEASDSEDLNSIFSRIFNAESNTFLESDPIRLSDEKELEDIFDKVTSAVENPPPEKKSKTTLNEIFSRIVSLPNDKESILNIRRGIVCSSSCVSKKCSDIPSLIISDIRNRISSLKQSQLHNYLLERLAIQMDMGIENSVFTIRGYRFCRSSFQAYFGVSNYLLDTVLKENKEGKVRFVHGNKGNVYRSLRRDSAVAFIHSFAEVHCENLPDRHYLQLPSYLNIGTLFRIYVERFTVADERLGEREFYHVFNQYFGSTKRVDESLPVIIFQSYNTHPKCNVCAKISDLRKRAKNETEANYVDSRMREHMVEMRRKYLKFSSRIELAVRYPEDYLHLIIDDMDQAKIQSPYYCQNTKDLSNLLKLKNHLTGVLLHNGKLVNDKHLSVFVNNDQFSQGANKTVTIVFSVLLKFQRQLGRLPRKLLVQSDNCSKDLKNQYVLAFYYLLVELNVFEEVLVSHMPPGHTHNQLDFCFGLIANKLKRVDIPTFEALKGEISNVVLPSCTIKVHELIYTTDFQKFITDGHLLQIQGHRSFFQFKIRKENNLTKMYVKEDDLDDKFAFNMGIKLLSNIPDKIQMEISPFRKDTGYSEVFESVFNKFIPSLASKQPEVKVDEIKNLWEKRVQFLIELKEEDFNPFDLHQLRPQELPNQLNGQVVQLAQTRSKKLALSATFYPMDFRSFSDSDLKRDVSIVLYTASRKSRPWIGLIVDISEDKNDISVQWVKKDRDKYRLHVNADGSPYISSVPYASIMFSDVLLNMSKNGDRNGPYSLDDTIRKEIFKAYKDRDDTIV